MTYTRNIAVHCKKKYEKKKKEIIQWLDLSHCFILSNKSGRIVFSMNGKTCMIYIKSTNRSISRELSSELQNYRNYGIKAEAVYNVYDMNTFLKGEKTLESF